VRTFIDMAAGREAPREFSDSAFWSSALALQVPVALGLGRPARVDLPEALGGAGVGAAVASDASGGLADT
jgi:hypothetical protein